MRAITIIVLAIGVLLSSARAEAYSVLAHEANVDVMWDSAIVPVLKQRYPRATADELKDARAYAYGGCIIQDLGYYPFGSHFFSDLLHYTRSGQFVWRLIADAHDVNELAFGLGALAHYSADSEGHPLAVNRVVPMMYPKLRAKYGDWVTYAQSPKNRDKHERGSEGRAADAGSHVRLPPQSSRLREEYGVDYQKPRWWARLFGVLFKLVPKIGPFRPLSFKVPTPEAEQLFLQSFAATQQKYRMLLGEARTRALKDLPNVDLDTGYPAARGEYSLADKTCAKLIEKLEQKGVRNASCS